MLTVSAAPIKKFFEYGAVISYSVLMSAVLRGYWVAGSLASLEPFTNRRKLLTPWSVTILIPGTCKPWDLALVVSARPTSALNQSFSRDRLLRLTIVEPVGTLIRAAVRRQLRLYSKAR